MPPARSPEQDARLEDARRQKKDARDRIEAIAVDSAVEAVARFYVKHATLEELLRLAAGEEGELVTPSFLTGEEALALRKRIAALAKELAAPDPPAAGDPVVRSSTSGHRSVTVQVEMPYPIYGGYEGPIDVSIGASRDNEEPWSPPGINTSLPIMRGRASWTIVRDAIDRAFDAYEATFGRETSPAPAPDEDPPETR